MFEFETILEYINGFLDFVSPVGNIVRDFFDSVFFNIPAAEQLFRIASGLAFTSMFIYLFYRLLSD